MPDDHQISNLKSRRRWWSHVLAILGLIFLPIIGPVIAFWVAPWPKIIRGIVSMIFAILPIIIITFLSLYIYKNSLNLKNQVTDMQTKYNVSQIQLSLEMYVTENGKYPKNISEIPDLAEQIMKINNYQSLRYLPSLDLKSYQISIALTDGTIYGTSRQISFRINKYQDCHPIIFKEEHALSLC